jgi:site-specific DNA-methyltransferase (adenine-specific)
MEPTWQSDDGKVRLFHADCREVLSSLKCDAIVSDPPYGMDWNTDSSRFSGGQGCHHKKAARIVGDAAPFDPMPFVDAAPECVLWGFNHFAQRVPHGSCLIWLKKSMDKLGAVLSDCEVAWKKGGTGVYAYRCVWDGCARESEHGQHHHAVQKPVVLMEWCISHTKGRVICDPFMGSGPTGIAAVRSGREFIGIETDREHFETACRRIQESMGLEFKEKDGSVQRRMFGMETNGVMQ